MLGCAPILVQATVCPLARRKKGRMGFCVVRYCRGAGSLLASPTPALLENGSCPTGQHQSTQRAPATSAVRGASWLLQRSPCSRTYVGCMLLVPSVNQKQRTFPAHQPIKKPRPSAKGQTSGECLYSYSLIRKNCAFLLLLFFSQKRREVSLLRKRFPLPWRGGRRPRAWARGIRSLRCSGRIPGAAPALRGG